MQAGGPLWLSYDHRHWWRRQAGGVFGPGDAAWARRPALDYKHALQLLSILRSILPLQAQPLGTPLLHQRQQLPHRLCHLAHVHLGYIASRGVAVA